MVKGNNQTIVRDHNMKLILEALKMEKLSSSDLAKKFRLSKPALTKIMGEMQELNLVLSIENGNEESSAGKGRKKTYFTINGSSGIVGAINFQGTYIQVLIADMTGAVIEEKIIEDVEFYTMDILETMANDLKTMLKSYETEAQRLLAICIAAPGKINKFTSEIEQSPKFLTDKKFRLDKYFSDIFHVKVAVKNDINMLMVSEVKNGTLPEHVENAVLLYIDVGIGGAILNENKILDGDFGFAGEFGLMKTFDRFGNHVYYDSLCSTNSIKRQLQYSLSIGEQTVLKNNFSLKDIFNAFHGGDALVRSIVLESAKYIGFLVANLYNIFNYHHILISGSVTLFGEDYLKVVKDNLGADTPSINLSFAQLDVEATTIGVISTALEFGFDYLLELRKNK